MLRVLLYPQEQRAFIPISANQDSWRRGSNFPREMQIFRLSRHHLAEGVEFPEKNAGSGVFAPSFGGGGSFGRRCHPIGGVLNHAALSLGPPGLILTRLAEF